MQAKKSLGQYFLRCRWVTSALIGAAEIEPTDVVLEIGPGTGILTKILARHAKKVIAVEKDECLADSLKSTLIKEGIKNVEVISGDILKKFPQIAITHDLQYTNYKLVSNIPYYLTSRLLRLLLEAGPRPKLIVLTIQKEVAERIVAKPPQMNLLSLSVQAFGMPSVVAEVPPECFYPKPKVNSAVIKISSISRDFFENAGLSETAFFSILKTAFSKKRKVLRGSLGGKKERKEHVSLILRSLRIPETTRPQELPLESWKEIVKRLQ